jgi:DNA-binding transcriptional regulator YhcF (GntR family)
MKRALSHRDIIEMIITDPPSNIRKFAKQVGCSAGSIARVVARLERDGLISPRRRSDGFLWDAALEEVISRRSKVD